MGLQTFQKSLILTDYVVNRAAYLKSCINKAKPKLRCQGRCQMMKKMQAEEKKESNVPERKTPQLIDQYDQMNESFCNSLFYTSAISPVFIILTTGNPVKMPRQVLRPPDNCMV